MANENNLAGVDDIEEAVEAEAKRVAGDGWYDVSPAHQALYRAGARAVLLGAFTPDESGTT